MYPNFSLISTIGLSIDLVVSLIFTYKLFRAHKKNQDNRIIKYFFYYFLLFAIFLVLTFIYQTRLGLFSDTISKISFALAIGVMLIISMLVYEINFEIIKIKDKLRKTLIYLWGIGSILLFVLLLLSLQVFSEKSFNDAIRDLRGLTPIVGVMVGIPFIIASVTFIKKGLEEKRARKKYILLGLSFLFVIVGGPLHSADFTSAYFVLADILTTAGFVAAFVSIFTKD